MGPRRRGGPHLSTGQHGGVGDTDTARDGNRRRPDASMSILVDLMQNAVDSGYAVAAARRQGGPPDLPEPSPAPPRRPAGKAAALTAVVVLAAAGVLFATSAVQAHRGAATARKQQQQLAQQAAAQTASTDALAKSDVALRQQIAAARSKDLAGAATGSAVQASINALELAVGGDAVSGPGLTVVLDDAAGSSSSLGVIYDSDLQSVANALWSSGAEAIAINGQRLSSLSSIREAGGAILVNYRPLDPPYTVQAVGAPGALPRAFAATETDHLYTTWSQIYGLTFTVSSVDRLTLPSAANLAVNEAKPLDAP